MSRGPCRPLTSTRSTWTVPRSRGSTCAAISSTAWTGCGGAAHRSSVGGYDSAEDPRLDAREAHPIWIATNRKRLVLGDAGLTLLAEVSAQRLRVSLADDLTSGAAYTCAVPLGPSLRGQLDAFNAQAQAIDGRVPAAASVRVASRAALLHLRALQALDGAQAGASHRDIAQALFGLEAVVHRWHDDGELRAQVRHLLRRAEAYMKGGYLILAGVARTAAQPPGDEPMR